MKMMSSGMSMVEILTAVVVIGMALIPVLSTFSASHRNTSEIIDEVNAVNFASELIEALQALPIDQLAPMNDEVISVNTGNFSPDPFGQARAAGNVPAVEVAGLPDGAQIRLSIVSYPVPGVVFANTKLIKVDLKVGWSERNREVRLMTLRGRFR